MENKNNNLEDFLRKKLSDFSEISDSWDKPDAGVWVQAQQEFPGFAKSKSFRFDTFWKVGLFLLLLFSIGYIIFLQRENHVLKLELDKKTEEIWQNQEIAVSDENLLEKSTTIIADNEKLATQNKLLYKQKTEIEHLFRLQQESIIRLTNENQGLQNSIKKNTSLAPALSNISDIKSGSTKNINTGKAIAKDHQSIHFLFKKTNKIEGPGFPKLDVSISFIPLKKKRRKFEVGYEYALLGLNIPVETGFGDLSKNKSNNRVYAQAHGFYFAYAPQKNLYIRTGLRTSTTTVQQNSKLNVEYDKSGEYIKQNGAIGNDLKFDTKTFDNHTKSDITVEIPQGAAIENGDFLIVNFSDYQNLRYFQVPLGVEYFYGKGRWQWHLQGGIQWTQITFGDYTLNAKIYTKDEELPVDKIKVYSKSQPSKQYFSSYGGFGLNFQISETLHARADLAYTYDFINIKSKDFSNSQFFSNAFKLGLNYRF